MHASITCNFIWIITVFVIRVILAFLYGLNFPTSLAIFYAAAVSLGWLFACHVPLSYITALLLLSADHLCSRLPPVKLSFCAKSNKGTHFKTVNTDLGHHGLRGYFDASGDIYCQAVRACEERTKRNLHSAILALGTPFMRPVK